MLYWGIALLGVAILLLVLEAFIPSGGVIAMVSGVCAVAGVVLMFRVSVSWGLIGLLMVAVLGPIAFFAALNLLPQTPMGRALLGAPSDEELEEKELAAHDREAKWAAMKGREAVAVTDLRPVGEIRLDGVRHEAASQVGLIEAGTRVVVVSVESGKLRVRAIS